MIDFIKSVHGANIELNKENDDTAVFFKPIIDSMKMEDSYHIRIPCYNLSTINPDWPLKCERGNQWTTQAQIMLGGDTGNVKLDFFDNFHRVMSMFPHHLPQIEDWKTCKDKTMKKACTLKGWTVSENYYEKLDAMDTGFSANAAFETKAKLLSKQMIQLHAGDPDADFHKLDDN